jgi:hypothetical protein
MLPLYLDINPNHDASTTLNREQVEYRIQAIPTSFEQDIINLEEFINGDLISVFTNLSLSNQPAFEYLSESSTLNDDFDVISRFEFKTTKRIKARLRKSEYSPSIIIN